MHVLLRSASLTLVGLFFFTAQQVLAGSNISVYTNESGIALTGHDPVAYFSDNKATAGKADITATHNGAIYRFASEENRDKFSADPDKYVPQFGGFCSFGTTMRKKIPGDPQAFKVVDGKLYINSSPKILIRWSEDIPGNINKANGIWPEIKDIPASEL